MVHSVFSGSRSGIIPSRKFRAWTLKFAHTRQCRVPTTKVNSNSINSFSPNTNEKGKRLCNLIPNGNCGSVWPELHPIRGEKQTHRHKGLSTSSRTPSQGGSCSQLGESYHSCISLYSFLSPMEEGLFVTCGARTLALSRSKRKSFRFSRHMCTRCGWTQGPGLMRKAHVCLGSTDRAAYLRGSLSMSGSCAHCPSGCHPFEERETLMGTKGSSKGKFLLQAGPKVPAIKEIIVVLHLAYLCPLSPRDKYESL